MANAVATIEPKPKSVLVDMATRYGMEPAAFEQTMRATVIKNASREELAAFLLVAKEYGLNPLTKEIYAFPAKGGGIVPVVSIDGWVNLINSHAASDGFEFDMEHGEDGSLVSCTCRMYRKDRSRPITITEYLSECIRGTEPWKMKHRMLRHKALIQAARYAFGFSGIYDEDEGERIISAKELRGEFTEVDDGGGPPNPANDDGGGPPVPHQEATSGEVVDDGGGPQAPEPEKDDPISSGRIEKALADSVTKAVDGFPGDKRKSEADDLDIPDYLRRTPDKPPIGDGENDWLESLENAFSSCEDMTSLAEQQDRLMTPEQHSVSTTAWNEACDKLDHHVERVSSYGE